MFMTTIDVKLGKLNQTSAGVKLGASSLSPQTNLRQVASHVLKKQYFSKVSLHFTLFCITKK